MQIPKTTLRAFGIYFSGIFALLSIVQLAIETGRLRNYTLPGADSHHVFKKAILVSMTLLEVLVLLLEYRGLARWNGRNGLRKSLAIVGGALMMIGLLAMVSRRGRARVARWILTNWFLVLLSLFGVVEMFMEEGTSKSKGEEEEAMEYAFVRMKDDVFDEGSEEESGQAEVLDCSMRQHPSKHPDREQVKMNRRSDEFRGLRYDPDSSECRG